MDRMTGQPETNKPTPVSQQNGQLSDTKDNMDPTHLSADRSSKKKEKKDWHLN